MIKIVVANSKSETNIWMMHIYCRFESNTFALRYNRSQLRLIYGLFFSKVYENNLGHRMTNYLTDGDRIFPHRVIKRWHCNISKKAHFWKQSKLYIVWYITRIHCFCYQHVSSCNQTCFMHTVFVIMPDPINYRTQLRIQGSLKYVGINFYKTK